jgi:hypothetical protein
MKKFVLGNVNFIGELINNFVLSKKIVFQCIENLFKRFEKIETDEKLRVINLEAIVVLMDKFGTLLKNSESKMKKEMLDEFNQKINDYIKKLDVVQKESKIPGYVKYKIINLIERKKNNWIESKYQKSIIAKSLEQVRKEHLENQKRNNEKNEDDDYYKYDQDDLNDKIRIDLNHWKEFIDDGMGGFPIDYKFICLKGNVVVILVCSGRETGHPDYIPYDTQWTPKLDYCISKHEKSEILPRPHNLDEMIATAKRLSSGLDLARVDLYSNGTKIWFGEITLTPDECIFRKWTQKAIDEMGEYYRFH